MIKLLYGDCLEVLQDIDTNSVDMVLADPPYGTTQCRWDSLIPLELMWEQLLRVCKQSAAMVFTASQPFTTSLISSNIKMFRYCWVYQKTTPTGHLNANKMPMRAHEDIVIFYRTLPIYNPQMTIGHERKVSSIRHKRNCVKSEVYQEHKLTGYDSTERYPISVQVFSTDKQKSKLHSTQKPIALMEYLARTYTNEGDTVLDFCMGSGTTGVACINLNRNFVGIELDPKYFEIAQQRITKAG